MPIYDDISRAAYLMEDGAEPWTATYNTLAFPDQWTPAVLDLCNHGRAEDSNSYYTAPTSRLDSCLQALAPDLIVRARPRGPEPKGPDAWLYTQVGDPAPLPGDTFHRLIDAWLRDLRPEPEPGFLNKVIEVSQLLRADTPQWETHEVDLLGVEVTDGGTAAPAPRQYQLAADALARRILELDPYDFRAGTLTFQAVPRGPWAKGAELVSQPIARPVKDKLWWFSIYINITLHTSTFDPRPRLHIHTGVRRWATHPGAMTGRVYLPYRKNTSVHLTPVIPWLAGAPSSSRPAVVHLAYDRAGGEYRWGGNTAGRILRALGIAQKFPDPGELLSNPTAWIGEGAGTRAAIVHGTSMGSHGIGAGIMSDQRSKLTEWIEQALPPGMRRAAKLTATGHGTSVPANSRPAPTGKEAKAAEEHRAGGARRRALAIATRILDEYAAGTPAQPCDTTVPHLQARLLWQTPELREAAIAAFAETLGLPERPDPAPAGAEFDAAAPGRPALLTWHTPELTVTLRCLRLTSGLAEGLGINPKAGRRRQALTQAIADRRAATATFLAADGADPKRPGLALVELDRAADFGHRLNDPKFALRLGGADGATLTQFAAVPKKAKGYNSVKNLPHRVRSAWLDGLRQLGVRVLPQHTLGDSLPDGLRYADLWMVKRRADGPTRLPKHVPVAVMATPIPGETGLAAFTGWDPDDHAWIPYPVFLLRQVKFAEISLIDDAEADGGQGAADGAGETAVRVTSTMWRQNLEEQRKSTEKYLQKMIHSLRGAPTALLACGQNGRLHWRWLQDGQAEPDLIKLGHAPAAYLDPDLRLIRVRTGDGRETPQWWGNAAPGSPNGLPAGLWRHTDTSAPMTAGRVFYSTTPKASTFRDSAVEADILATRPLRQGKNKGKPTTDVHIPAWNPDLVEITILGCHEHAGDDPEAYALAMHQMRQAPDYLDALTLPLPLHMASLAQEYVLPTLAEDAAAAGDGAAQEPAPEAPDDQEEPTDVQDEVISALGLIPRQRAGDADFGDPDETGQPGLAQEPENSDYLF